MMTNSEAAAVPQAASSTPGETTSTPLVPPVAASRNVYVASLPQTLNDAELMNLFSPFGIVLSAKIMREKKTRQSKGYGFVLFRDEDAAATAVRAMNTAVVASNRLQVRLAHPSASKDLSKQCRSIPACQSQAHRPQNPSAVNSGLNPTMGTNNNAAPQLHIMPTHGFALPQAAPMFMPLVMLPMGSEPHKQPDGFPTTVPPVFFPPGLSYYRGW